MGKKIAVGVISCSGMAQSHMEAIIQNNNAELKMICDINQELLADVAKKYDITNTTTDYREMLANPEIEAVVIVTPDQTHCEIAVAALEAGKHVLCEKPMALTIEDCQTIIDAEKKAKTKLMIGQICRFTPGFVKAKELIDKGEIGELFFVETEYAHDYSEMTSEWRMDPLRHGFLGGGCHAVDLARWIAGDPIEVMAYSNHKMLKNWPTDDCTIAIFKFHNDVIGKVFVSTGCKRNYTMRSVFYGSKGTIITDNTSPFMTVFTDTLKNDKEMFNSVHQKCSIPVQYPISINNHNTIGEIAEFIDCIINDRPVSMTAVEGAKTVVASLAAVEASAKGKPVEPEYIF